MNNPCRTALAVAAILVAATASIPAHAACGGNPLIQTVSGPNGTSFIWNSGTFVPGYYPGLPPYSTTTPWTTSFEATFWALGTGDPAIGPGDDAGIWTVPPFYWAYHNPTYYVGGYYYAGTIFGGWGAHGGIDGCIQNNPPGSCTCVLMTDEDGVDGYYAITSNAASAGVWITQLTQPGNDPAGNASPIILTEMVTPIILNSVRNPVTYDLCLTVTVPHSSLGQYELGGCECGPVGYRVLEMRIPRGSAPPASRQISSGWTFMNLCGGAPQPITPIGVPVDVESLSGGALDWDLYLAAQLYFDSDFATPIVSGNSTRIEAGPNLAEPEDRRRFRPGTEQVPQRPNRERTR
jgi:hypothetical protein